MQHRETFSVAWGSPDNRATENHRPFKTDAEAKAARDLRYKTLKAMGRKPKRSILRGQLREWWGWGMPCGIVCNVYEISY